MAERTDLLAMEPGTKNVVKVPVTQDLGGSNIDLHIHVLTGREKGPALSLLSLLHGTEWQSLEVLRRVVERVDPSALSGTVLALPVANPVSFCHQTRNVPDESDSADLNRAFGNKNTWIADQLAQVIAREMLERSDAMIDYHIMPWGAAECSTSFAGDLPVPGVSEKSWRMAAAYGVPCVTRRKLNVFPGPKSSYGHSGRVLEIPCMGVSLGGLGFDRELEEEWIETNVRGTINVMKHLGMLDGELILPDRILLFDKGHRVNPTVGGLLKPVAEPDRMMREVKRGELLGRVISAGTFELLEELRSPCAGYLWGMARSYPVRPGDWSFLVIDGEAETTRWVTPDADSKGN